MTPRTKVLIGAAALVAGIVLGILAFATHAVCPWGPGSNLLIVAAYFPAWGYDAMINGNPCSGTIFFGTVLFWGGAGGLVFSVRAFFREASV